MGSQFQQRTFRERAQKLLNPCLWSFRSAPKPTLALSADTITTAPTKVFKHDGQINNINNPLGPNTEMIEQLVDAPRFRPHHVRPDTVAAYLPYVADYTDLLDHAHDVRADIECIDRDIAEIHKLVARAEQMIKDYDEAMMNHLKTLLDLKKQYLHPGAANMENSMHHDALIRARRFDALHTFALEKLLFNMNRAPQELNKLEAERAPLMEEMQAICSRKEKMDAILIQLASIAPQKSFRREHIMGI